MTATPKPRKRDEATLERNILRALGRDPDLALYRNEVGKGFYGCVLPILRVRLGRWHLEAWRIVQETLTRNRVTYGLSTGSPDLVGICRGTDGRGTFVGLELKTDSGRVSDEQQTWHAAARSRGGVIEVVRSVEEAREVIERIKR